MVDFKRTRQYINKNTIVETILIDPQEYVDPSTYLSVYYRVINNSEDPFVLPSSATIELSETDKEKILSDDETYLEHTASASSVGRYGHVIHRFVWNVKPFNTPPNILRSVEFGWDGYSSGGGGSLMLKRRTGWETLSTDVPDSDGTDISIVVTPTPLLGMLLDNTI